MLRCNICNNGLHLCTECRWCGLKRNMTCSTTVIQEMSLKESFQPITWQWCWHRLTKKTSKQYCSSIQSFHLSLKNSIALWLSAVSIIRALPTFNGICHPVISVEGHAMLRSENYGELTESCKKLKCYSPWSFCISAAPTVWNNLLHYVCTDDTSHEQFICELKTFWITWAYLSEAPLGSSIWKCMINGHIYLHTKMHNWHS